MFYQHGCETNPQLSPVPSIRLAPEPSSMQGRVGNSGEGGGLWSQLIPTEIFYFGVWLIDNAWPPTLIVHGIFFEDIHYAGLVFQFLAKTYLKILVGLTKERKMMTWTGILDIHGGITIATHLTS